MNNPTLNNTSTIKLNEYIVVLVQQYGVLAVVENYIDLREAFYVQKEGSIQEQLKQIQKE